MTREAVLNYLRRNGPTSKALADDERQSPDGCLWSAIEALAREGLVQIKGDVARIGGA